MIHLLHFMAKTWLHHNPGQGWLLGSNIQKVILGCHEETINNLKIKFKVHM